MCASAGMVMMNTKGLALQSSSPSHKVWRKKERNKKRKKERNKETQKIWAKKLVKKLSDRQIFDGPKPSFWWRRNDIVFDDPEKLPRQKLVKNPSKNCQCDRFFSWRVVKNPSFWWRWIWFSDDLEKSFCPKLVMNPSKICHLDGFLTNFGQGGFSGSSKTRGDPWWCFRCQDWAVTVTSLASSVHRQQFDKSNVSKNAERGWRSQSCHFDSPNLSPWLPILVKLTTPDDSQCFVCIDYFLPEK